LSFIKSIFGFLRFNKRNWKAVVLCLFAATVFWFFNALNKTYTTNISFPLAVDFNSSNYVAVKPLPEEVRINVTGIGWSLFRRSLGVKVPSLVIPLERPSEVKKIVGSTLPGLFSNQLEGLDINFVLTDTLYLNIQPKAGRWIKVSLKNVDSYLQKNYTSVSDVRIIPDSIFIEGPMNQVTRLKEPVELSLIQNNIDENFRQDVEVILLDNQFIRRNPPTVAVAFDVEKLVTLNDSVKLTLQNIPGGSKPAVGKSYIKCVFAICESMAADFRSDSVHAIVDLNGFKRGSIKVVPKFIGLPPHSKVLKVDTVRIRL
jgi:hypothetical protein